jgi:nitrite reductase/ring-hydroxylating ferredoxin subunit
VSVAAGPVWQRAATRAEVVARGALRVQLGGRWVALLVWQGRVHAVDDRCPHRGASLADGIVENGAVACLEHGWEYDLASGKGLRAWEGCVEVFPVEERGDEIWVQVTPPKLPAWAVAQDE